LIEAIDIDGLRIVTFAPNGFVGMLATGLGAEVQGFVVAEAVATPPASSTDTTHPTTSAARASLDPAALGTRRQTLIDMLGSPPVDDLTRRSFTPRTKCLHLLEVHTDNTSVR
jgi:hypothetical protein